MINRFSLFLGGLGLFALQGCKTQQGEQAQASQKQTKPIYHFILIKLR